MLQTFVNEKFPKWAKILLCIFGDAAGVYRVLGFVDECLEKKEEKNLSLEDINVETRQLLKFIISQKAIDKTDEEKKDILVKKLKEFKGDITKLCDDENNTSKFLIINLNSLPFADSVRRYSFPKISC